MKIRKKGKQLFAVLLSIAMIITTMPLGVVTANAVTAEFAGGSGTEADPYLIETKEHLNNVRDDLDAHYKLIADIVFTDADFDENGIFYNDGKGWLPIGIGTSNAFSGTIDGGQHTITGLRITITSSQTEYAGLFGFTRNAKISNIVLVDADVYVKGRYACVGGVAGYTMSTHFDGCESSGTIESSDEAGGIVGYVQGGSITNCNNSATVISSNSGGGIVGATDVTVSKCSNSGDISSIDGSIVGGIVGYLYSSGSITLSYNTGNISAIENRVKQGSPTTFAGGICGESSGVISSCYNVGTIYAKDASGYAFAGGITGAGNVYSCYNVGDVSASASATYYVGAGGIVGDFKQATANCYYINTCNKGSGRGTNSAIKCMSEDLCDSDTFVGFNFNTIWEFTEGNLYKYPTLKSNSHYVLSDGEFQDGLGTEESPYLIASTSQLNNVRNHVTANFKLVRDIVFTSSDFSASGNFYNNGQGWKPIGSKANAFTGVFDGNGFNIENLYINLSLTSDAYIGLFGYSKGEINNLGVIATNYVVDASNKNAYVGGVVGYSESNIANCSAQGKINVESTSSIANEVIAGGIVGTLGADKLITINSCFNDCDITVIRNITSTATSGGVATTSAGGVIGKTTSDTTILNCINAGNIYTTYNGGQLVDIVSGGILGKSWFNTSVFDSCYNSGNITAYSPDAENTINNHAGGIVGDAYSFKITKCYNAGNISSNHNSGGIFANTTSSVESEITDCFNVGNISSGFSSGGIGGSTEATITNCYNVGFVEGKIYGGIVGFNNGGNATVANCFYWDIVDKGVGNWDDNAVKCCLLELKKSDTYQGFDFENDWSQSSDSNYAFPVLQGTSFVFEKELATIKIKTLPTKLKYLEVKDTLNVSGGEIELFYNNGDVSIVSLTNNMISGFNNSKVGTQTLTVTYEGKTCNYDVEVIAKSLVSIAVTTKPSKLSYLEGKDKLNVSGGIVTLYYDNDTRDTVNLNSDMVAGFNNAIVGEQNLTVTYKGKTTSFSITITPKTTTSISIISKPNKLTYLEGENFETAGLVVKAYYNNDTSSVVNDYTISGYSSSVGTKTITVSYGGKTTTFTVTVNSRVPSTVTSSKHTITGNNISKITAGTTVSSLLSGLNEGSYCKVYKGNSEVSGSTAVGTGMVVKIMDGNTVKASYTVIVTGDTNGDGAISVTDMIAIKAHILNKSTLTGVYATAANTNGDSGISITDFIQIKAKILGKGSITAR